MNKVPFQIIMCIIVFNFVNYHNISADMNEWLLTEYYLLFYRTYNRTYFVLFPCSVVKCLKKNIRYTKLYLNEKKH